MARFFAHPMKLNEPLKRAFAKTLNNVSEPEGNPGRVGLTNISQYPKVFRVESGGRIVKKRKAERESSFICFDF